jgi:hypothetical protein
MVKYKKDGKKVIVYGKKVIVRPLHPRRHKGLLGGTNTYKYLFTNTFMKGITLVDKYFCIKLSVKKK